MIVEWEGLTLSTNRAYHKRPAGSKGKGFYLDKVQKAAREAMGWAVAQARGESGETTAITGPVSVSVHIAPGSKRGLTRYRVEVLPLPGELSPVLCDCDSSIKGILDVLAENGVYGNDRQVVLLSVEKERKA
jgi:Holliday junction resolvase RusA-like endonuclease